MAAARCYPKSLSPLSFHEQFSPLSLASTACGGGALEELERIAVQHHGGLPRSHAVWTRWVDEWKRNLRATCSL